MFYNTNMCISGGQSWHDFALGNIQEMTINELSYTEFKTKKNNVCKCFIIQICVSQEARTDTNNIICWIRVCNSAAVFDFTNKVLVLHASNGEWCHHDLLFPWQTLISKIQTAYFESGKSDNKYTNGNGRTEMASN